MKRLKVLVSAYACNPIGSLQLHPGEDITGWRLVEQLNRFHDVWVITHSYNRKGVNEVLSKEKLSGINFYFINLPSLLKLLYKIEIGQRIYYYLWQILAWKLAKKLHKNIRFDVAHHITFGNYWMPSFIGAYLQVPFIWGPVGGGQKIPKGLIREYSIYGRLAEKVRDIAQWVGRNLLFSRRRCLKKAKAILVCNYETKMKIPKQFTQKVHLFPVNGISKEDLNHSFQKYKSNESFLILTAGRFHRLKGFDISFRAFHKFVHKFQNSTLEIIGNGPEEDALHQLVKKLQIKEKIRFTPWLPRKKLLERMHEADVFLFPSFRDGGGAVVIEAMASGIPVICIDTGGPGFHIQEEWGVKIEPRNTEYVLTEMAEALEKLYLDKELRERLGKNARKRAEEFYLWDRLGERLQKIYSELCS